MTAKEIQKRNGRAQKLRVIQVDEGNFYVESAEGKICYRVTITDQELSCTCGDFARNSKDNNFRCKHILAVLNCTTTDIKQAQFLDKKKPKLDERFIKIVEGQEFVTYRGLLDLAHQKGLMKISVEAIQFPDKENGNFAICKAVAESSTGEMFTDVGDANPLNCNSKVSKHLLRMASTRAKARCLRDMTNIGMTCLEELDMVELTENGSTGKSKPVVAGKALAKKTPPNKDASKSQTSSKKTQSAEESVKPNNAKQEKPDPGPKPKQEDLTEMPKMSEAQKRAVYNLSRRRGISVEDLERMAQETFNNSLENLSSKDASAFIRNLQQAA